MKNRCAFLISLSLIGLAFLACARQWVRITDYQRRVLSILYYISDQDGQEAIDEASRSGGDALEGYFESYWAAHDPLPETPLNEYRNLYEARLTTGWDSLISPMTGAPDSRIIPYVLYGSPTRVQVFPHSRDEYLVSWIYRPTFDIPADALQYPTLEDLDFTITFIRNRMGNHRIDRESAGIDPELPVLTSEEISELAAILRDERMDPYLRMAASWRLRADPGPAALRAFLTSTTIQNDAVRETVEAAIHPLAVSRDVETGESIPVAAELDSSRWQVDSVYDREMLARMRRILLNQKVYTTEPDSLFMTRALGRPYDPAEELPDEVVEELGEYAARDSSLLRSRGWLSQAETETLFTGVLGRARSLLDGDNPLDAHKLLEPLLGGDLAGNPEAWHLDALSLMESAEPGGREQAEERIRKALRLDPGNLRYELTLVRVLFSRTFDRYADRALDRMLGEFPSLADAYALKGRLRLEIHWNLGWRAGGWGTPLAGKILSVNQMADEAMGFLNMALVLDPDNAFASWWLGTHFMLTGRWIDVIQVMNYLIEQRIHLPEAYLGRGFAYQNLGLADEAFRDYRAGLELLPSNVRILADDPRWALPPSQGGLSLQEAVYTSAARERLPRAAAAIGAERGSQLSIERDLFWRSKDPLLATELNERLMEQYRRFAHVCWRFALPSLGLRGWETHRGRIYLRFGEPLTTIEIEKMRLRTGSEREGIPGEFSLAEPAGGSYGLVEYEYWYYDGFRIPLMIGMITGNRTVPYPEAVEELIEIVPESPRVRGFREVLDMNVLELGVQWYRFEDTEGRLELFLHTQFPKPESVSPEQEEIESYTAGLTLLDSEWNRIAHQNFDLPVWLLGHDRSFPLIAPPVILPAGTDLKEEIYAALEMVPPGTGPAYASRDTVKILPQGALRMSSLVAASTIIDVEEADEYDLYPGTYLTREGRAIVPLNDGLYYHRDPVYLCFEIYGLEKDEFNATKYQLAVEMTALRGEDLPPPVIGALGRLIGIDQREGRVKVVFEREGISSRVFEENRIVFPLESETTRYQVTIEVTDLISGESVRESVILQSYSLPY